MGIDNMWGLIMCGDYGGKKSGKKREKIGKKSGKLLSVFSI